MTFYDVTTKIREQLQNDPQINTVSFGNFFDLDLNKQTIYALANVSVSNIQLLGQINRYTFSIVLCDIVDVSNSSDIDPFVGNNNLLDIINTQVIVGNTLVDQLRRGDLYQEKYQLAADPTLQPFYERFDNVLAGVAFDLSVDIKNNTSICG